MANRLKMALIDSIHSLYQLGWSQRRIAHELGLNRETVARHLGDLLVPPKPANAPIGSLSDGGPSKPANAPIGSLSDGDPSKPANAPIGSLSDGDSSKPANAP